MKLENLSVKKFLRLIGWPAGNLFSGAALSVFGHEKPTGGFVRRVADRCVSGMGRDLPALFSKEADLIHRQPVPDAG